MSIFKEQKGELDVLFKEFNIGQYSSTIYVNNQGRTIELIALDTMLDVEQWRITIDVLFSLYIYVYFSLLCFFA